MSATVSEQQRAELERTLGLGRAEHKVRGVVRWTAVVMAVIGLVWGYRYFSAEQAASAPRFLTEAVTRGNLVVAVSATGNLQPTIKVDVGSELSGTIEAVLVENNDRVKRGQVLARLDTSRLKDQVARTRAALLSAEARVQQTRATVEQSRSNLERLREVARLSAGKVPSKAELDTAEATLARALADEAAANAAVAEVRAVLSSDETNLGKAAIRSPIDGVVLARRVEPGQTVAASFQAPVLFTLAQTLSQMELQVDVDEADVGHVQAGQRATFTVDAYPGRNYPARITRVGFGSQVKDGVVSYLTTMAVDNADLSLRPGMTATATIVTATREDVLLVPNAALRFTPPPRTPGGAKKSGGIVESLLPRPPRPPAQMRPAAPGKDGAQRVWVLRDAVPVEVSVVLGVTDGRHTEIVQGELQPGMAVITEALGAPR